MHSGADRIGLLRKKIDIRGCERLGEWLQVLKPLLSFWVVPRMKFLSQFQGPGPTVCALKRLPVWLLHVSHFGTDIFGGEVRAEGSAYLRGLRQVRKHLQQSHQHPVAV